MGGKELFLNWITCRTGKCRNILSRSNEALGSASTLSSSELSTHSAVTTKLHTRSIPHAGPSKDAPQSVRGFRGATRRRLQCTCSSTQRRRHWHPRKGYSRTRCDAPPPSASPDSHHSGVPETVDRRTRQSTVTSTVAATVRIPRPCTVSALRTRLPRGPSHCPLPASSDRARGLLRGRTLVRSRSRLEPSLRAARTRGCAHARCYALSRLVPPLGALPSAPRSPAGVKKEYV